MISGWMSESFAHDAAEHLVEEDDDAEDHGRGTDDRSADEHGLGRGLEGVARTVRLFQVVLAVLEIGIEPELPFISALMLGTLSIWESSYTDWALSETGPKLSTAMVTGPIPRKPKATRPKAKTGAAKVYSAGIRARIAAFVETR